MFAVYYIGLNLPNMYLHRFLTHRTVTFSPVLTYFTKVIMWLKTSQYSQFTERVYVASHLVHHSDTDTEKDPHSPYYVSRKYIFLNVKTFIPTEEIHKLTAKFKFTNNEFDRFLEKYSYGYIVLFFLMILMFSWHGIILYILLRTTRYVSSIFNIILHVLPGYVNSPLKEPIRARNILLPVAFIFGGEELHGNHHKWPNRANLAVRWWEVDSGYLLIKLLSIFKLITINPCPKIKSNLKVQIIR